MRSRAFIGLALTCGLVACSSDKSADYGPFLGLYRLDSHTHTTSSCDVEGGAVTNPSPMIAVYSLFVLSEGNLTIAENCADAAACRERATQPVVTVVSGTDADFSATFTKTGADGQSLTGAHLSTDASRTTAIVYQDALVRSGPDVRIEMRTRELPCTMSGGTCDEAATIAAAASAQCLDFTVVRGTFLESL